MRRYGFPVLISLIVLAGCGNVTGARMVVQGTGPEEYLKLRAGPGLGFSVILGLPEGTALIRHDCVTELGQLWCKVSLADAPQLSGYVSADYLSEP
jgi:uncharacterized protein YraI